MSADLKPGDVVTVEEAKEPRESTVDEDIAEIAEGVAKLAEAIVLLDARLRKAGM